MKKLIFLLALIVFAVASCKEKKPADYTRLGFYTTYQTYMEKLNGKVETVIEKGYWAIPEGDSYIKGDGITKHEFDSIGFTYDYKANFDIEGDLISCPTFDENDKLIYTWNLSKVNNIPARAEYIVNDTVRFRDIISCDEEGNPVLYERYNALADTLSLKAEVEGSHINDTLVIQYYSYKGEPGLKSLLMFNELGLLTHVENYMTDGTPGESYNLVYNDKGFNSEITFFDKDKTITGKIHSSYDYDDKGNWIKLTGKDDRGFAIICERVYTYFE